VMDVNALPDGIRTVIPEDYIQLGPIYWNTRH